MFTIHSCHVWYAELTVLVCTLARFYGSELPGSSVENKNALSVSIYLETLEE